MPDIKSLPIDLNSRMKNSKETDDAKRLMQINKAISYARDVCYEYDERQAAQKVSVKNIFTPVVERSSLKQKYQPRSVLFSDNLANAASHL